MGVSKELNMANRDCCNVYLFDYATKKLWMKSDWCNTTTAGFSSDAVFANKKGAKDIKFDNPLEGTMTMVFQVYPFQVFALYSDGGIETSADIAREETVTGEAEGVLTLKRKPIAGTVYVRDANGKEIEGSVAEKKFTATTTSEIAEGTTYEVFYLENKVSGVKKVSINNKKVPKDFFIQMETNNKDENGQEVPLRITAYKASPNRNLDLSFSSDGDPAEITVEFSVLQDRDGNVMDIIEIESDDEE